MIYFYLHTFHTIEKKFRLFFFLLKSFPTLLAQQFFFSCFNREHECSFVLDDFKAIRTFDCLYFSILSTFSTVFHPKKFATQNFSILQKKIFLFLFRQSRRAEKRGRKSDQQRTREKIQFRREKVCRRILDDGDVNLIIYT